MLVASRSSVHIMVGYVHQKPCDHTLFIIIIWLHFFSWWNTVFRKILRVFISKVKDLFKNPIHVHRIKQCSTGYCWACMAPMLQPYPSLPFPLLTSPYKSCVRLLPSQLFRDRRSQGIWSAIPAISTCSFHATIFQPLQLKSCHKWTEIGCNI